MSARLRELPETDGSNPWLTIVVVCVAQFMIVLDATIVNVALPSIQRGLHFSTSGLQWVITIYTLAFGGFMLLGGRLGDVLGRRRVFGAGIAIFTTASLLNGSAQSPATLTAGRGLQGLGGALLAPAVLSIITTTFGDGSERAKALAIWSAISAGGGAVGLILGGVLTDLASWRWIFFVNVPVGAVLAAATARFVPPFRSSNPTRKFDLPGAVTVTAGLMVLVFAVAKSAEYGWGSTRTILPLAVGLGLLVGFIAIEGRSTAPLVRLGIFHTRSFTAADITLLLTSGAVFSTFYFVSLYLQQIVGFQPLSAGTAFLPFSAGIATGATVARKLVPRLGVRAVAMTGLTLGVAGMVSLIRLPVEGRYVTDLLPSLLALGFGLGLTFVPITLSGTSEVGAEDAGLASGLLNTAQQVGGSIGLAILATLSTDRTNSFRSSVAHRSVDAARVSGYHVAFIAAAVLLGAAWMVVTLRAKPREAHPIEVPRIATARAIGCAQCAPVAGAIDPPFPRRIVDTNTAGARLEGDATQTGPRTQGLAPDLPTIAPACRPVARFGVLIHDPPASPKPRLSSRRPATPTNNGFGEHHEKSCHPAHKCPISPRSACRTSAAEYPQRHSGFCKNIDQEGENH